jgi:Rad3-related DNA helicase
MTAFWIPPTGEQLAVIDACAAGTSLVVEAGAGTGKTSTLLMAAIAMDDRRGIYLAYNRATAQAARRRFPASVTCVTAHALAYRADRARRQGPRMGTSAHRQ